MAMWLAEQELIYKIYITMCYILLWIIPTAIFALFLCGNINKAYIGFEMVLCDINSVLVKQELIATGLLFL